MARGSLRDAVETPGTEVLPPAGDRQRDVLKERTDRLAERAETAPQVEGGVNPKAFEIDREIAQYLHPVNLLEVSNKVPGMRYKWVHTGQHSYFVTWATAQGWEIVSGDMPEAAERRDVTGARRIGDTILLRIPEERALRLDRAEYVQREMQQKGIGGRLAELGERYRSQGLIVHTDLSTINPRIAQAMQARAVAGQRFDQMLHTGTVPGLRPPGGG